MLVGVSAVCLGRSVWAAAACIDLLSLLAACCGHAWCLKVTPSMVEIEPATLIAFACGLVWLQKALGSIAREGWLVCKVCCPNFAPPHPA